MSRRNPKETPPDAELTFCLDESVDGPHLCALLRGKGATVVNLKDHLERSGTRDEEWLPYICRRGWIIISRDNNIRRRLNELLALKNAGGRMFVIRSHNLTRDQLLQVVDNSYGRMLTIIAETPAPFIANILRSGEINIIPLPDWQPPTTNS